ncbi:BSD domain [Trinorchestia longiramus]|nr:BSD domain [Trinorchestia longiramus]
MAEGGEEASWWGWLQTAKDKVVSQSSEVLEFVRNDIDEFRKVVSEEASTVVSSTATALKTKLKLDEDDSTAANMKKSMSGFLSHVADVFTPPPNDEDEEAFVIANQQPVMISKLEAAVYSHIQEPDLFLEDPKEEADYTAWLETFDMEAKQVEIADLLVSCKPLHKQFSNLVPQQVSHSLFWHRYFYLVHRLQQQQEKRQQLTSRVTSSAAAAEEDSLLWEDDETIGADVDIPEDVQTRLLQQYEQELMTASTTVTANSSPVDTSPKTTSGPEADRTTASLTSAKVPHTTQPKSSNTKQSSKTETSSDADGEIITPTAQMRQNAASKNNKSKSSNQKKKQSASPSSSKSSSPAKSLSSESNEDEWEKLDVADECDSGVASVEGVLSPTDEEPTQDKPKGEDWETWE